MADERVREILGFDPEGENSKRNFETVVPPNIQQAFLDHCRRSLLYKGMEPKIYPDRLLVISPFSRTYYVVKQMGVVFDFQFSAEAHFIFEGSEESKYVELETKGEASYPIYHIGLDFEKQNVSFMGLSEYSDIEIYWYSHEQISAFKFLMRPPDGEIDEHGSLRIGANELKDLSKKSELKFSKGFNNYELGLMTNSLIIKRFAEGSLRDELTFPRKVDFNEIANGLFDSQSLKDPRNSPADLDDSWRFANLMDTVGVKWERH